MRFTPLKMHPFYKAYLWGGTSLKSCYKKEDAPDITAESWELALHPDGFSTVKDGPLAGKTLRDLAKADRGGYWGSLCHEDDFPILVKLIDTGEKSSVQVHPSDATAIAANGERGKAEMWYVADCKPNACIYLGFSRKVSKEEFSRRAKDGTICEVLNKVPVNKGDVYYILPGTIHAICDGIVIAEIQQNSNTTFRIYDYDRRDSSGNKRLLHWERANEVIDSNPILPEQCRAKSKVCFSDFTMTEMFSCPYFRAFRIEVHHRASLNCDGSSFHHLLCVDGEGTIISRGVRYPICKGESYFLPAKLGKYELAGDFCVLLSRV